jgi:hypothetical protein
MLYNKSLHNQPKENLMKKSLLAASVAAILTACGGGGDDVSVAQPPVAQPQEQLFNYKEAVVKAIQKGYRQELQAFSSNGCTGRATITAGSAYESSFEGMPALAQNYELLIEYTNCQPSRIVENHVLYYDNEYSQIADVVGQNVAAAKNTYKLPEKVKPGDAFMTGDFAVYLDSDRTKEIGTFQNKAEVEAMPEKDKVKIIVHSTATRHSSPGSIIQRSENILDTQANLEFVRWTTTYPNGIVVTFQK